MSTQTIQNESEQPETLGEDTPTENYILLKDINWFGVRTIPAGTIYKKKGGDYWWPVINYSQCPSHQIDFYTVRNNPEYFLKITP